VAGVGEQFFHAMLA